MIYGFAMVLLIELGMVSMLFFFTFVTLQLDKGQLYEIIKAKRHPHRFTDQPNCLQTISSRWLNSVIIPFSSVSHKSLLYSS